MGENMSFSYISVSLYSKYSTLRITIDVNPRFLFLVLQIDSLSLSLSFLSPPHVPPFLPLFTASFTQPISTYLSTYLIPPLNKPT